MNKLEFDSITLRFGFHQVLSSVHVACETGQLVGLLGRNGAGKSCLMRIVFGSMSVESRSVRWNGRHLSGNYMNSQIIGYLPQDDLLPDFITFEQALNLYEIESAKIEGVFPDVRDFLKRKAYEVSGGQRRFFEVLLILFARHPFCFLDEPFSGLMPVHIESLSSIIQEVKLTKGILISDHLHRQVRGIADKLYVLVNGETYLISSVDQLIELGYLTNL
jgi:ABC-type multidrug transport system ATPase subunit